MAHGIGSLEGSSWSSTRSGEELRGKNPGKGVIGDAGLALSSKSLANKTPSQGNERPYRHRKVCP